MLQKPIKNPNPGLLELLFFPVGEAGARRKFFGVWGCDLVIPCRFYFPGSGAAQLDPPVGFSSSSLPIPTKFPAVKSPHTELCLHNSAFLVKQKGIFCPCLGGGRGCQERLAGLKGCGTRLAGQIMGLLREGPAAPRKSAPSIFSPGSRG